MIGLYIFGTFLIMFVYAAIMLKRKVFINIFEKKFIVEIFTFKIVLFLDFWHLNTPHKLTE